MMKTNLLLALSSMLLASTAMAQNIDFDLPGKTTPGKDTELNYISWAVPRATSDTKTFDNEADITDAANGGWEEWPEEHRTADWDTDQDGMPDWWEKTIGSDPNIANHNDDPDHDGWTLLEDYLDFMAHPYVMIQSNGSAMLDLKSYFAGFYGQNKNTVTPTYTVNVLPNGVYTASVDGSQLEVSALQPDAIGIYGIDVTINDGETQWTQRFGIIITTDAATAISQQPIANSPRNATLSKRELPIVRREFFTLDGRQVTTMQSHETYIMRTTDAKGHRQSLKIIKN
jgi:hypothetical protein